MIIAVQQPNYLPWLGYFYKMARADIFVLLDTVQYEKNGFTNRVKVRTAHCPSIPIWLTLPVGQKFPQRIDEVELMTFPRWRKKHIRTLELDYRRAKHFDYLFRDLREIMGPEWQYLSELNIELIMLLKAKLGIGTRIEIASNYNVPGKGTDLLVNLCREFGADTYLSGVGGQKYQDEGKFEDAGIGLEYVEFDHPVYPQLWEGDFLPGLSAVDLLFNCGPESLGVLEGRDGVAK